eukprot:gene10575-12511_t
MGQRKILRTSASAEPGCYLGIDFGTSGARATAINDDGAIVAEARQVYGDCAPEDRPEAWKRALEGLFVELPEEVRSTIKSIAIDGTSSTAMLVEKGTGRILAAPLMYNDPCPASVNAVKSVAPADHTVLSSTSTLCKLVSWFEGEAFAGEGRELLAHQSDWLAYLLHGVRALLLLPPHSLKFNLLVPVHPKQASGLKEGVTDYNNALKLGFDPDPQLNGGAGGFPTWLTEQEELAVKARAVFIFAARAVFIFEVRAVFIFEVRAVFIFEACAVFIFAARAVFIFEVGLPSNALVCAGTTDSIAAFLAAEVTKPGQAVTSLGSTLAIKLLSDTRLDDAASGIY